MKEKWKYFRHGYYEVSNKGRVRRAKPGTRTYVGRIMIPQNNGKYLQVRTCVASIPKAYLVHVLVARKFIGPKPDGMEVNHKDLNKENNKVTNLEYITSLGNMQHAIDNGVRMGCTPGESKCKLTIDQVKRIRKKYATGRYTQKVLSIKYNVHKATIERVLNKSTWRKVA
jgi:hypothetical protein